MTKLNKAPIMLIVMDGFGNGDPNDKFNAVALAKTPVIDELRRKYPHNEHMKTSGEYVGLPDGQMGNSEVGHTNIGAGRVVYQQLTRITRDIRNGDFFKNKELLAITDKVKATGGTLHLMGLVSPGGVHSHEEHLYGLLELAKREQVEKVAIHAFLDGRDVPPKSAEEYLKRLEEKCAEYGVGKIVTVSGRYYAMDRDKRWERVTLAYETIAHGKGERKDSAVKGLLDSYADTRDKAEGIADEFVIPFVVGDYQGMTNGDGAIFFNFRPDRGRQLTHAFVDEKFDFFPRDEELKIPFTTFVQYEDGMNALVAFPPESLNNTMGEYIESLGMTQLRIAETEKYPHVTFFFNGGVEEPYKGEDRILVNSPKVATYDLQPEMSAFEVTDRVVEAIKSKKYDFIILNYANCDMVGHTGVLDAVIKAVETTDTCVGRCVEAVLEVGGELCITADHGNADKMFDYENNQPFTKHTTNPVPFIVVSDRVAEVRDGALCDIAPTMLALAGLEPPKEMTGKSLVTLK